MDVLTPPPLISLDVLLISDRQPHWLKPGVPQQGETAGGGGSAAVCGQLHPFMLLTPTCERGS